MQSDAVTRKQARSLSEPRLAQALLLEQAQAPEL
jgi:hypothetical protein